MIGEKPLENMVSGYSNTSIFRTIAFIGDSLSSGEFETRNADGKPGYTTYTNIRGANSLPEKTD